ncbi:hypothetical protein D9M72_523630 [compost metagenome]
MYGIPFGKTTSKAESLSVATITRSSSLILYTSRTFPLYTDFWPGKLKLVAVMVLLIFLVVVLLFERYKSNLFRRDTQKKQQSFTKFIRKVRFFINSDQS